MTSHFRLSLSRHGDISDEELNVLVAATRGEASFGTQSGRWYAEFDRETEDLPRAVIGAQRAIESASPGTRVVQVDADESQLVAASDIARRVGLSREAIRLLADGERGRGDFPLPATTIGRRQRLWRWADVQDWFHRNRGFPVLDNSSDQSFIQTLNTLLDLRERGLEWQSFDQEPLLRGLFMDVLKSIGGQVWSAATSDHVVAASTVRSDRAVAEVGRLESLSTTGGYALAA